MESWSRTQKVAPFLTLSLSLQEPRQFTPNFSSLGWHVSILFMLTFLFEACSCVVLGHLVPFPAILLEAYSDPEEIFV